MPLTDLHVRSAKPHQKAYKLADAGGLHLFISPSGARIWRLRFSLHGKDRTLALGAYPLLSLKQARDAALVAKRVVHDGDDPVQVRRKAKFEANRNAAGTFHAVAEVWIRSRTWTAQTRKQYDRLFKRDIFPVLGRKPVNTITMADVRRTIDQASEVRSGKDSEGKRKKLGGTVSAQHVKLLIAGVLDRAVEDELCTVNVARIRRTFSKPKSGTAAHVPTPYRHLNADGLKQFLTRLDEYRGEPTTAAALRLMALCFTRPSELREAQWCEFDVDAVGGPIWRIPKERMKSRRAHDVPLSDQAVEILSKLRQFTGRVDYLFPNERDPKRPMGRTTLQRALGYLKLESSPHGFRHTASTLLHEQGFDSLVIEHQLGHTDRNPVRAAYNKATYIHERRRMLQHWANWLDKLKAGDLGGNNVLILRGHRSA